MSSKDEDRARSEFTSEAEELLDALSRDLSEFESQGRNVRPEVVNKIFREVHSLKGLSSMFGVERMARLAHALEDRLDALRMGRRPLDRPLDVVLGHVGFLRLRDSQTQPGIAIRIPSGPSRNSELPDDSREDLTALRVLGSFVPFNCCPVTMSTHVFPPLPGLTL